MKTQKCPEGMIISGSDLDIYKTFDCGQCFRFEPVEGGVAGIAMGKRIVFKALEDGVLLEGVSEEDYQGLWKSYLDMDRDYDAVNKTLAAMDKVKWAAECGYGIHILNQEPWEALCSFIISQNNNIPRIKKIIEKLCLMYGEKIAEGLYAFPTPKSLAEAEEEELRQSGCGFRARYIKEAARAVYEGAVDLEELKALPYEEAFKRLTALKGVGPKVANCVLLFGLGHTEAFPVDVWIKRVLIKYFDEDFDPAVFGKDAGIAQQYLFYGERYQSNK